MIDLCYKRLVFGTSYQLNSSAIEKTKANVKLRVFIRNKIVDMVKDYEKLLHSSFQNPFLLNKKIINQELKFMKRFEKIIPDINILNQTIEHKGGNYELYFRHSLEFNSFSEIKVRVHYWKPQGKGNLDHTFYLDDSFTTFKLENGVLTKNLIDRYKIGTEVYEQRMRKITVSEVINIAKQYDKLYEKVGELERKAAFIPKYVMRKNY